MIDVDNQIYTIVAETLEREFEGILVVNRPLYETATFPVVTMTTLNNMSIYRTSFNKEVASQISIEFKSYSNLSQGGKEQAKNIAMRIDDLLIQLGFTRVQFTEIPNYMNQQIYQYISRYTAVIDKNLKTYRR